MKKYVLYEILIWTPSVIELMLRILLPSSYWYAGPAFIGFIIYSLYCKKFVYFSLFKKVFVSFRCLVLIASLITTITCDTWISIAVYKYDPSHWIHTLFDDIFYTVPCIYLLILDCIKDITKVTRIILPLAFLAVVGQNIY